MIGSYLISSTIASRVYDFNDLHLEPSSVDSCPHTTMPTILIRTFICHTRCCDTPRLERLSFEDTRNFSPGSMLDMHETDERTACWMCIYRLQIASVGVRVNLDRMWAMSFRVVKPPLDSWWEISAKHGGPERLAVWLKRLVERRRRERSGRMG